jgi:PRTRC genetic system ThiF family protein
MYVLTNRLRPNYMRQDFTVAVVGCGGTGGFVAEGLCRLLPEDMVVLLIDHDQVEQQNLVRQNFYPGELGQFKSQALARRLSERFRRRIAYLTTPISTLQELPELVIGCVDNGLARRDIAERITEKYNPPLSIFRGWWIDAGNGRNFGQVLVGNCPVDRLRKSFESDHEICFALPLPTEQRSELLLELPPVPACAEAVALDEQSPVINQGMASLVLEVVYRILVGNCPWMQLNFDMEAGTLTPVLATPENVARMTGINVRSLTFVEKKERR